jgi:pimeloyl-ACP methyl ester carboxylesterase
MTSDPKTLKDVWTIFDGLPLLYRTNATLPPEGARTIIHIHGFAISGRYLLPTASRLAPEYATFVPDLPGFGRSHHPPHPLTIDQLGEAVVRFMDQLGIERAVLLGNSLGCPIIASMLDEHIDRIEATVWVSPAGGRYNLPIYRGVAQMVLAGLREPPRMVPIAAVDYAHYGLIPSINLLWSMLHYPTVRRLQELVVPALCSGRPAWQSVVLSVQWSSRTSPRRSSTERRTRSTSRIQTSSPTSCAVSSRVDRSRQTRPRRVVSASSKHRASPEPEA